MEATNSSASVLILVRPFVGGVLAIFLIVSGRTWHVRSVVCRGLVDVHVVALPSFHFICPGSRL